jgi:hypothetical protein
LSLSQSTTAATAHRASRGAALAVVFDVMTRLRHGKPIHPRGIVA